MISTLGIISGALTEALTDELCGFLHRVVFVANDYIIREQEGSDSMYFITSGTVEVFRRTEAPPYEEEVLATPSTH